MLIDGVLGSEAIDSSAEVLSVEGADVSDWENGTFLANWEHAPGEKGADTIVGVVVYCKKILKESDCENDRQRDYWKRVKLPYIYGIVRLFDRAGHKNAQAIAAIIRDNAANGENLVCRFSVEGHTLERTGNRLASSILKRVAITVRPCNRTANSGLISDPDAPEGFKKEHLDEKERDALIFEETAKFEDPLCRRLGSAFEVECNPLLKDEDLAKTLDAGSTNGVPGTLTQGAALQREDLRHKVVKLIAKYHAAADFKKDEFRAYLKHELPDVSDAYIDHFTDAAEDFHVNKRMLKAESPVLGLLRDMNTGFSVNRLHALSVDVNHALSQMKGGRELPTDYYPEVHTVGMKNGDEVHPVGRILIHEGEISHLEDYHGLLNTLLPEGPMDEHAAARMYAMMASPHLVVHNKLPQPTPPAPPAPEQEQAPIQVPQIAERPASVFQYKRVGMDRPHTLEVHGKTYLLDGNQLSDEEVAAILSNVSQGTAEIRYTISGAANKVQKMESVIRDLLKSMEHETKERRAKLHAALTAVRAAADAGHIDREHERVLTQHLYEDSMTPGIGNKAAAEEFVEKGKPGVYVQMDGNEFRSINEKFGHHGGDAAIKVFGQYARQAMDEAVGRGPGGGKLFRNPDENNIYRNGGDEFMAHVPSHEHAAKFARLLSQKLDAHPPMAGMDPDGRNYSTHKMSMSFGFGLDAKTADSALYHAKAQKIHPETKQKIYDQARVPNLAHSLVPGFEGPINMHDPAGEAIHHHVAPAPKAAEAPKPPEPKLATIDRSDAIKLVTAMHGS